jgi:hypothetical protein
MNWRLKCFAHHLIPYAPRFFHRSLQKRITGRYFFPVTDENLEAYRYHVSNFSKLAKPANAMEFGAGSNLLTALLLSAAGAQEVLAYDLSRIATVEQVNHVIRQLHGRVPGEWREIGDLDADLFNLYRIRYLAPADARNTGLKAGSIDFFCSTSTLEHIPSADIESILTECRRLGSAQATFSFIIDYHDHYCSADKSITRVNFYKYSDSLWRFFNPSGHFQNRLRHSDYERIFERSKLLLTDNRRVAPHIEIDRTILDQKFEHYSDADLVALNGLFTLRAADSLQR